mgnify:CR=1 FL=1
MYIIQTGLGMLTANLYDTNGCGVYGGMVYLDPFTFLKEGTQGLSKSYRILHPYVVSHMTIAHLPEWRSHENSNYRTILTGPSLLEKLYGLILESELSVWAERNASCPV